MSFYFPTITEKQHLKLLHENNLKFYGFMSNDINLLCEQSLSHTGYNLLTAIVQFTNRHSTIY